VSRACSYCTHLQQSATAVVTHSDMLILEQADNGEAGPGAILKLSCKPALVGLHAWSWYATYYSYAGVETYYGGG